MIQKMMDATEDNNLILSEVANHKFMTNFRERYPTAEDVIDQVNQETKGIIVR